VGIAGVMFFVLTLLFREDTPALMILLSMFGLMFLPVAFIHIEYILENRDKVIEIDNHAISVFMDNELMLRYENSELEKIVFYKSRTIDTRGPHQFPTQYYFYAKFIPRGGREEIIVTSLMTPGYLEEIYNRGVKLDVKWSFFPSIRFPVVIGTMHLD
jgi:hypothetical protein